MSHSLGSSEMPMERIHNFYTLRPSVDVFFMKHKINLDLNNLCMAPKLFNGHGQQKLQRKNGALYKTSIGSMSNLMKIVYCIKQNVCDAVGETFAIFYWGTLTAVNFQCIFVMATVVFTQAHLYLPRYYFKNISLPLFFFWRKGFVFMEPVSHSGVKTSVIGGFCYHFHDQNGGKNESNCIKFGFCFYYHKMKMNA